MSSLLTSDVSDIPVDMTMGRMSVFSWYTTPAVWLPQWEKINGCLPSGKNQSQWKKHTTHTTDAVATCYTPPPSWNKHRLIYNRWLSKEWNWTSASLVSDSLRWLLTQLDLNRSYHWVVDCIRICKKKNKKKIRWEKKMSVEVIKWEWNSALWKHSYSSDQLYVYKSSGPRWICWCFPHPHRHYHTFHSNCPVETH